MGAFALVVVDRVERLDRATHATSTGLVALLRPDSIALVIAANADRKGLVPRLVAAARPETVVVCPADLEGVADAGLRQVARVSELDVPPEVVVVVGEFDALDESVRRAALVGARYVCAMGASEDTELLADSCAGSGALLIGGSSFGVASLGTGGVGDLTRGPRLSGGPIALVSDAGRLDAALLGRPGVGAYLGLGQVGCTAAEALAACATDASVQVILLRVVAPRAAADLVRAARACPKPVLIMAADHRDLGLYSSAGLRAAPADPRRALALARAVASGAKATGRSTAVVGRGAGSTAALAQAARQAGLTTAAVADTTLAAVRAEVPVEARLSRRGLFDLSDRAEERHLAAALTALTADPAVQGVLVDGGPSDPASAAACAVIRLDEELGPQAAADILAALGAQPVRLAERPAAQLAHPELVQTLLASAALGRQATLRGDEARRALGAAGLRCADGMRVTNPSAARRVAADSGYPVWLQVEETPFTTGGPLPAGLIGPFTDGPSLEAGLMETHAALSTRHGELGFSVTSLPADAIMSTVEVREHPVLGHVFETQGSTVAVPLAVEEATTLPVAQVLETLGALVAALPEITFVRAYLATVGEADWVVGAELRLADELLEAARRPARHLVLSSTGRMSDTQPR